MLLALRIRKVCFANQRIEELKRRQITYKNSTPKKALSNVRNLYWYHLFGRNLAISIKNLS